MWQLTHHTQHAKHQPTINPSETKQAIVPAVPDAWARVSNDDDEDEDEDDEPETDVDKEDDEMER